MKISPFVFFLVVSCILLPVNLLAHGAKRAYFDFSVADNQLALLLTIEADDLSVALKKERLVGDQFTIPQLQTQLGSYIPKHFKIFVNGEELSPELENITYGDKHFKINFKLGDSPEELKEVKLWTNYLNKEFPSHLNVFRLQSKGKQKFYQLHSARQEISHKYESK